MIVAVVGINEQRIVCNVTFTSSFDTTVAGPASEQVSFAIVPENSVADVGL